MDSFIFPEFDNDLSNDQLTNLWKQGAKPGQRDQIHK